MKIILITWLFYSSLAAPPAPSVMIFASEGINPFVKVWNASGIVESGNNTNAYNATDQKGGSWGKVQIGQSMLDAFNKANGTHYVLHDCLDESVSKKVFMWHFQNHYPNIEAACRSWNGGSNWKHKKSTYAYYLKIKKNL